MALNKDDLASIAAIVKDIVKDSTSGIEEHLSTIDEQINTINGHLDNIEDNIDSINGHIDSINGHIDTINGHIDTINGRLDNLEKDVRYIKVVQLENDVLPRLQTIEDCYLDTFKRYQAKNDKFDEVSANVDVLNLTVQHHSADIQELKQLCQA